MELFNIARVVIWSQAGLGTRNNRIYFSMYCALILIAVLWLVLRRTLKGAAVKRQWAAQYVVATMMLLWHMGLNTYDLYRDSAAGTSILTTSLLGLSLLIQSPPFYSTIQLTVSYLLFQVIMVPLLDAGDRLNLTITFVVALAVSLAQAHHVSVMLNQPMDVQCSTGACICTCPQIYQRLYAETDYMLYQAKKAGKGRCCVRQMERTEIGSFEEVCV